MFEIEAKNWKNHKLSVETNGTLLICLWINNKCNVGRTESETKRNGNIFNANKITCFYVFHWYNLVHQRLKHARNGIFDGIFKYL